MAQEVAVPQSLTCIALRSVSLSPSMSCTSSGIASSSGLSEAAPYRSRKAGALLVRPRKKVFWMSRICETDRQAGGLQVTVVNLHLADVCKLLANQTSMW